MRPEIEKEAIKQEVITNYKEVMTKIDELIRDSFYDEFKENLKELRQRVEGRDLPEIKVDLDKNVINSYWIDEEQGLLYNAYFSDFYFEYDNDEHMLFVSSYSIDTDDCPIH